jgi:hypothetical protein
MSDEQKYLKYLKYKNKYLELKQNLYKQSGGQVGGNPIPREAMHNIDALQELLLAELAGGFPYIQQLIDDRIDNYINTAIDSYGWNSETGGFLNTLKEKVLRYNDMGHAITNEVKQKLILESNPRNTATLYRSSARSRIAKAKPTESLAGKSVEELKQLLYTYPPKNQLTGENETREVINHFVAVNVANNKIDDIKRLIISINSGYSM